LYVEAPATPLSVLLVFVHGYFSASCIGPSRVFTDTAQRAASQGIASVRYEWRGMGNSTGDIAENDLAVATGDLHSVMRFCARAFPGIKPTLVAHSIGCAVALNHLRGKEDTLAGGLYLLAPGPFEMARMTGLCADPTSSTPTFVRKGLTLSRELLRQVADADCFEWMKQCPCPLAVAYCCDDELCDHERIESLTEGVAKVSRFALGGHNFASAEPRARLPEAILAFATEVARDE
jgi:pimeloyl-ACP methyl ester carboxylesterase